MKFYTEEVKDTEEKVRLSFRPSSCGGIDVIGHGRLNDGSPEWKYLLCFQLDGSVKTYSDAELVGLKTDSDGYLIVEKD
jgi:hypothetical protein